MVMNKEELRLELEAREVVIIYNVVSKENLKKIEELEIRGTLKQDLLPEHDTGKLLVKQTNANPRIDILSFFDLDKKVWRTIEMKRVKQWK